MTAAGLAGLGHLGSRRAEVEVSVASNGVCAGEPVPGGGPPVVEGPLARLHPEVSQ